jgi:hypothetical protein
MPVTGVAVNNVKIWYLFKGGLTQLDLTSFILFEREKGRVHEIVTSQEQQNLTFY